MFNLKSTNIYTKIAQMLAILWIIALSSNAIPTKSCQYGCSPGLLAPPPLVGYIIIISYVAITVFALNFFVKALHRNRWYANFAWVFIAPLVLMTSWAQITDRLVEASIIPSYWLTASATSGGSIYRYTWIASGVVIAFVFVINICVKFVNNEPKDI